MGCLVTFGVYQLTLEDTFIVDHECELDDQVYTLTGSYPSLQRYTCTVYSTYILQGSLYGMAVAVQYMSDSTVVGNAAKLYSH
jgi:hypothetical protein